MVLFILIYGFTKNTNIYDSFINGSKESFKMCIQILPNLLAMILAIDILINSNILESISKFIIYHYEIIFMCLFCYRYFSKQSIIFLTISCFM